MVAVLSSNLTEGGKHRPADPHRARISWNRFTDTPSDCMNVDPGEKLRFFAIEREGELVVLIPVVSEGNV